MFKFKSLISLVLILALAFFASPVFAQARHGIRSTGAIEASADLSLPAGTWVYGIKLYADAASSVMAIYDSATYASGVSDGDEIDEIGEATQYDSVEVWYPKPIYFADGVSVFITTGIGYVFYGPPPE